MIKYLLVFTGLFFCNEAFSQDSLLTYSKVLKFDSLSKETIYDRVTIWCSKKFIDSKSAIRVTNRESGLLGGKGNITSIFKLPGKKDSVMQAILYDYSFDWLIEIKENKLRMSISNITVDSDNTPVTTSLVCPINYMFTKKEVRDNMWNTSKKYFIQRLDYLTNTLYNDVSAKQVEW